MLSKFSVLLFLGLDKHIAGSKNGFLVLFNPFIPAMKTLYSMMWTTGNPVNMANLLSWLNLQTMKVTFVSNNLKKVYKHRKMDSTRF